MKRILSFLLLFNLGYSFEFVNIPDASTLKKGKLSLMFRIYDNGGIVMNSGFGLFENVLVGVPLDMENAIGDKEIKTSLPLVLFLRIKIIPQDEKIPSIAFGYFDPYGYKKRWDRKRIKGLKGLYIVGEKDVVLFSLKHHISFGFLADVEDYKKGGLSMFAGSSLKLSPKFTLLTEEEGIPLNKQSENKGPSFNLGARFSLTENLDLSLCFIDLFGQCPSRIVKIGYTTKVF